MESLTASDASRCCVKRSRLCSGGVPLANSTAASTSGRLLKVNVGNDAERVAEHERGRALEDLGLLFDGEPVALLVGQIANVLSAIACVAPRRSQVVRRGSPVR